MAVIIGYYFLPLLYNFTSFTGNLIQGYIGTYFSVMSKTNFFLLCAGIGAAAGVVTWLFNFPLKPILESRMAEARMAPEPIAGE